jgi:Fur family peroxide stress response transcriptional regulator
MMTQNLQDHTALLHKAGLRVTPQRLAICQLLAETKSHPTANEIFLQLKERFPSISLATIYNTLDVLVGMGVVNALGSIGDGKVHFDGDTSPHINLACMFCHTIIDVESSYVNQIDADIADNSGYRLLGSRVLYYGICPDCQKTRKTGS